MENSREIKWEDFDKFEKIDDLYLPATGEGENMATQINTSVTKLVYKWFNDGDVYDNTYWLEGWCNDLSSYANWLYKYVPEAKNILLKIEDCCTEDDYVNLLYDLAEKLLDETLLKSYEKIEKTGTIYYCDGPFHFNENDDDEEW